MDLIQNAELKCTYDKCKYTVKYWEHTFKKKYGRQPSKLDIKEAPNDVRYAYKTYFNLKTEALENKFKDIDAFNFEEDTSCESNISLHLQLENSCDNDISNKSNEKEFENTSFINENDSINTEKTWGEHLSIKTDDKVKEKFEKTPNILNIYSQKLFSSSKLSKRNPRKSLSFSQKSSDSLVENASFLSQPTIPLCSVINNEDKLLTHVNDEADLQETLSNKTKIINSTEVQTASVNIVESVLTGNIKSLRSSVDYGWMKRVAASTGTKLSNEDLHNLQVLQSPAIIQKNSFNFPTITHYSNDLKVATQIDYNSDDIVDNSEDEENTNTFRHISKKIKISPNVSIENGAKGNNVRLDFKNIIDETKIFNVNEKVTQKSRIQDESIKKETTPIKKRSSTRKRKTRVNLADSLESDDDKPKDPFETDGSNDSNYEYKDSDDDVPKKKKNEKKKMPRNKKTKSKKDNKDSEATNMEEGPEAYELEYSVKPRLKTVPRLGNIADTLKTCAIEKTVEKVNTNKPKTKREQEKEKFEKKLESGNLNENYVRINMKKKIFVRGKKNTNFSKYKKQQWKAKKKALTGPDMDMGGCDGGTLTCFKCGQIGHFARYCAAHKKGDDLLPKHADETYTYPTLEEAAEMVKDNPLMIRKPQRSIENDKEKVSDSESEVFDSDDEMLLAETIKMEEIISNLDTKTYVDTQVKIKPYYPLNDGETLIETPEEVFETLQLFGHSSFRSGQEKAIMRILSGKSTLVTLSTGSGKSLCYQLPAYLYAKREPCISLIISPLVSLMEDQVADIPRFLKAACLHTNQSKTQREKIKQAILDGNINILLVSPEAVVAGEKSNGFGSLLRKLPPIAFACIDEAHCLSQWSHNFRPSYLMICHILRDRLGVNTILGLTATATRTTSDNIIEHLDIPDGRNGIITDIPLPDNLRLTASKDVNRDMALVQLLLTDKFTDFKSIIVYCTRREECERIAALLRTSFRTGKPQDSNAKKRKRTDIQAEPYHAGMSSSRRKTVQKAFMSGELRIVVATVAFGMGINKSDIRAVIHYNMPSNFESYVQEVGRAGRDGEPAHCHLFLDSRGNDENELKRHIYANSVDRHVIRKLLEKIFIKCSCKTICPRHEVAFSIQDAVRTLDVSEEIISTLLCYLELHQNRYVEVLSPGYTHCKIISYSGPMQIRKAAIDNPLLTMALALYKKSTDTNENLLEFPIIDLASAIGWDSGICKHKLKNLEWITVNNQPKRSTLTVQFSNLGFRLLAPGNLSESQLDEALDSLYNHVTEQEKTALKQLNVLNKTVLTAVEPTYRTCITDEISEKEKVLKDTIRAYFNNANPLEHAMEIQTKPVDEGRIVADTRTLLNMYPENIFTGKAVARIFFGIQSPNYPAVIWGRCKLWRSHLGEDFYAISKLATKEILQMRRSM